MAAKPQFLVFLHFYLKQRGNEDSSVQHINPESDILTVIGGLLKKIGKAIQWNYWNTLLPVSNLIQAKHTGTSHLPPG